MNTTHFLRALDAANHGEVTFTKQALDAFSIGGKWYPLRAVIKFARENAGESMLNTHGCRSKLNALSLWVQYKKVKFQPRRPVAFSVEEAIQEARDIAGKMK